MKKKVLLTALLLSALSINGHAYGANRLVVGVDESASIISETITVSASSESYGGAIYTQGNLTVQGATFDGNKISSSSAYSCLCSVFIHIS